MSEEKKAAWSTLFNKILQQQETLNAAPSSTEAECTASETAAYDVSKMEELIEMGFYDLDRNALVLHQLDGDMGAVVDQLLALQLSDKVEHPNVRCHSCDALVLGTRYKCSSCADFDLCQTCKEAGIHAHHSMISIADPNDKTWMELCAGGQKPEMVTVASLDDIERQQSDESSASANDLSAAPASQSAFDFTRFPPCMNILVLGETGVGKSTFINGLANYLNYGTMRDALINDVHILIHSAFTLTDDDFTERQIVSEPTIPEEHGSAVNESTAAGQSATQDPRSYIFNCGDDQDAKLIRIIDTPGIGDTRGIDQDKKNFDKILQFISSFNELHAICILIKPNSARLTLAFRFCIDELLVHLHKSACHNIVFCFTNTRGTLYKPGDTLPVLREHLTKLDEKRGIKIPLDKTTLFSFDNESFRFLCAKKAGMNFTKTDEELFNSSWNKSVEETQRMFQRIAELPVHHVTDTLCLNNTRSLILALTRPLAEIARNQMINMQLIREKMDEVKRHTLDGKQLLSKLFVDQIVIIPIEVDKPQTVCTSNTCVEYRKFSAEDLKMKTVYKTICHKDCQLVGVQAENCPNTMLQRCWALFNNINKCRTCGCPWGCHMHIRYTLDEKMIKVTDPDVQESIRTKNDAVKTIEIFLTKEQQKIDELQKEHNQIMRHCAEFGAFLAANSILPYNDSYGLYVEHMIREEQDKVNAGGDKDMLNKLKNYKEQYDQQVQILSNHTGMSGTAGGVKSVEQINAMVVELNNLKHCGSTIEEIKKIQLHSCRQSSAEMGKKIYISRRKNLGQKLLGVGKALLRVH